MKIKRKNSNPHPEAGFADHFAELRGFGVARTRKEDCRALAESPDFVAVATAGAAGTTPSACASSA
jgi:hypothetical protein